MNNTQMLLDDVFSKRLGGDWGKSKPTGEFIYKVYCIRGADIDSVNSKNLTSIPVRYVKLSSIKTKSLTPRSIVMEISGGSPTQSTGRVAWVDQEVTDKLEYPVICTNFCRALLVKDEYDPEYIFYWLKNLYNHNVFFNFEGKTTGIKNLDLDVFLKSIRLDMPSIQLQEKISKILSLIDRKIDVNNRINNELKKVARLTYDYWFTQFDFPDVNGKPYKTSGGKMICNDQLKRDIPDGWTHAKIKDFESDIITGKTPPTGDSSNFSGDIPFITIDDIRGNTFVMSTSKTLTDKGAELQKKKYIPEGSLCVTCIATPGLLGFSSKKSQTNQQVNTIVFSEEHNKYYLYHGILDYFRHSSGAKSGNTFANMNKGDFENIILPRPTRNIMARYHEIIAPCFDMIKKRQMETVELAGLRDWLLPMLMSGRVRVGE